MRADVITEAPPGDAAGGFAAAPARATIGAEWRELGAVGRLGLAGIVLSAIVAVVLGFAIEASVRRDLLDARGDLLERVVADLGRRGLIPLDASDPEVSAAFDEEVQRRLLGGETVRVKLWAADGTVVYSDEPRLVGRRFELEAPALQALQGVRGLELKRPAEPENEFERGYGELMEFYLPARGPDGRITGVFEVYQRSASLNEVVQRIGRRTWLSIGSGLLVLGISMLSLTAAHVRSLQRRREEAERLFAQLLRAEDEERRRVVGALHDDVGQPLYRILYGLRGSRARLDGSPELAGELERLEDLVTQVDSTLRGELRRLNLSGPEEVGLRAALAELVATARVETDLEIALEVSVGDALSVSSSGALFRAVQEALVNARKHAAAGRVTVSVRELPGRVVAEVADDGRGVSGPPGLGLATARQRLQVLGGGLELARRRTGGTLLRAWVPTDAVGG